MVQNYRFSVSSYCKSCNFTVRAVCILILCLHCMCKSYMHMQFANIAINTMCVVLCMWTHSHARKCTRTHTHASKESKVYSSCIHEMQLLPTFEPVLDCLYITQAIKFSAGKSSWCSTNKYFKFLLLIGTSQVWISFNEKTT